ncbi:hypothetical protein KUV62_20370 [Salipiger bermudensis]|uniref:hypothetical protein n=1 Tax=Salipiger bermudensis TaxID=344736 RepID=UPI001C99D452|nr:hypothetical protein [Salipiger bermudensis]MBY6006290.1 hypothetical protein [Salipiger bermudensis]
MDQIDGMALDLFKDSTSLLSVLAVASLGWVAACSGRMPRALRGLSLVALAISAVAAVLMLATLPTLPGAPLPGDAGPAGAGALYALGVDLGPLLPGAGLLPLKYLCWPLYLGLSVGLALYAIGAIATPREDLEAAPRKARLPMSKTH